MMLASITLSLPLSANIRLQFEIRAGCSWLLCEIAAPAFASWRHEFAQDAVSRAPRYYLFATCRAHPDLKLRTAPAREGSRR